MNAQDLRDKFDRDLLELQNRCSHRNVQIMAYECAPGHYAGVVRVCLDCEKVIEEGV